MSFDIILPSVGRLSVFQAIESVLHQDYTDWRLWIVCDGIAGLDRAVGDPRVTVLGSDAPQHSDFGAWARNTGIAAGQNDWIAYIDDDDVWLPNHLSVICDLREAWPDATMIRTAGQSFSLRSKSPRSKDKVRKLGAINYEDILTVGMAHTRELFKCTAGWLPCDNHDKLLWNAMLGVGGNAAVYDAVTFQFAR
jgi:glycosyltransferase involved in cell wall biosynthesis